jgi:crotonobetainyl-CoA:carnitine CoA-transferase CaiB-like acyl-CoA transferase
MISELVDGRPAYTPSVIADKVSGLHIVIAVLAALAHRHATGQGQHVDVPMVDTMIAFNLVEHLAGHTFDPPEGEFGWGRVLVPERMPHRTADGWMCLMPYSQQNWTDFFRLCGRADLIGDPRFTTVADRHRHMGTLLSLVDDATPNRTTAAWLALCAEHDIPAAPLLDLAHAQDDDYVRAQGLLDRQEHPSEGAYWATRTPLAFSASPIARPRPAPRLGEHSTEILTELGYTPETIEALTETGVLAPPRARETTAS